MWCAGSSTRDRAAVPPRGKLWNDKADLLDAERVPLTDVLTRLAGSLADRYEVQRELGAGGMATVYRAVDLKHQRDVAIKVLHPELGAALGGERFLSEIRTTARLQAATSWGTTTDCW